MWHYVCVCVCARVCARVCVCLTHPDAPSPPTLTSGSWDRCMELPELFPALCSVKTLLGRRPWCAPTIPPTTDGAPPTTEVAVLGAKDGGWSGSTRSSKGSCCACSCWAGTKDVSMRDSVSSSLSAWLDPLLMRVSMRPCLGVVRLDPCSKHTHKTRQGTQCCRLGVVLYVGSEASANLLLF